MADTADGASVASSALTDKSTAGLPPPQIASQLDPYEAIVELAERELMLARGRHLDELPGLAAEWNELTATLPAVPPASARAALERAAELHAQTNAVLLDLREAMLCDLQTTVRASRAARGYARVGRRALSRVDRSA